MNVSEVSEFRKIYSIVRLAWHVAFSLVNIQCDKRVIHETNFILRSKSETPTSNINQAHIHVVISHITPTTIKLGIRALITGGDAVCITAPAESLEIYLLQNELRRNK